ncbi:phosphotransferase family protein [Deinococcus sp. QL22]|uniref:phosphotransferase family protein n=1 Tax=Deinococcus sp. QL22 TaxID=2939437 RepID=UPI0020181049|nr:phosphotransferase family protein [Deinococcus sp. QL22]UQN09971.1 phosphotransferase family protein [Deinococcus sp. QL22]
MSDTAPVRAGEELPLDALREALRGRVAGDVDALTVEQFPGGFSNLTYLVRLGEQGSVQKEYVLRRAPLGPVPKGAHDMAREFRLLERVHPVFPQAPKPALLVEDPAVLGSPFYLMERRNGLIVRDRVPPELAQIPDAPQKLSFALANTLAALHAVDIEAAGLGDIGRAAGFNGRQVEGWAGRWRRARTEDLPPVSELRDELVIGWLTAHTPAESAHTLVHNDFKLDNLMVDPADPAHVTALLDWEMTTVGDPLADLGLTLTYWAMPEQPGGKQSRVGAAASAEGFLTREGFLERYAAQSGRDVSGVLWYEVLGHFKLAVIVQQIYARYRAGQTGDPRFAPLGQQAAWLMGEAWRRINATAGAAAGAEFVPEVIPDE